jgi:hypothetical protein
MPEKHLQDYHVEYLDVTRHWSPKSEKYSGCDSLLTAIYEGWKLSNTIYVEDFWHLGQRRVPIYHFELSRNGETHSMVIVDNPYVWRLSKQPAFRVLPISERTPQEDKKKQKQ